MDIDNKKKTNIKDDNKKIDNDDVKLKVMEEQNSKKLRFDMETIWIGGIPYFGVKPIDDIDLDDQKEDDKEKKKIKSLFDKSKK